MDKTNFLAKSLIKTNFSKIMDSHIQTKLYTCIYTCVCSLKCQLPGLNANNVIKLRFTPLIYQLLRELVCFEALRGRARLYLSFVKFHS